MGANKQNYEPVVSDIREQAPFGSEELLTVHEVADLLRVPVSWVYDHTRSDYRDRLPCVKVGKYLRFFAADILDYLQSMRGRRLRRR